MHKIYVMLTLVILLLAGCQTSTNKTEIPTFEANWESLNNYKIPEWFADAKFGIFIHWGPYCVPEFGSEWYPRLMYADSAVYSAQGKLEKEGPSWIYDHHIKNWGHPGEFGYKDFIPMFTAENFDADQWMSVFQKAGARYVIPVAEHHDGFAMYNSNVTRWNAVNMGPKRDLIKEMKESAAQHDLRFGVSSHFAFNWDYYNKKEGFDTNDPQYEDLYGPKHPPFEPVDSEFMKLWWKRTSDIIDNYQPEILWFDFYIDKPEWAPYHPKLAAYYYNKGAEWGKEVVLQTKNFNYESFPAGTNVLDIERGKLADIRKDVWQTDTSVGTNSWGYVKNWISRTPNSLIDDLIDIVSKNGCLLLNVGPKKDGTIPQDQVDVLLEMGKWLDKNGEAIYNTRPWERFGEGPTVVQKGHHSEGNNKGFTSEDIRFTQKDNVLYAIVLDIPVNGEVLVKSLANHSEIKADNISSIEILGESAAPEWAMNEKGLQIKTTGDISAEHAMVVKITL